VEPPGGDFSSYGMDRNATTSPAITAADRPASRRDLPTPSPCILGRGDQNELIRIPAIRMFLARSELMPATDSDIELAFSGSSLAGQPEECHIFLGTRKSLPIANCPARSHSHA
jgi:hypothetical protein